MVNKLRHTKLLLNNIFIPEPSFKDNLHFTSLEKPLLEPWLPSPETSHPSPVPWLPSPAPWIPLLDSWLP
jgi:hypothetical protein